MTNEALISLALKAREGAYAPYSGFAVGAALLASDGTVYTGCNIENASYSATVCAERVAFGSAVSDGKREFLKIAIVGGRATEAPTQFCMPCGICRQVMREFCKPSFEVIVSNKDTVCEKTLAELLPESFAADALQ